MFAVEVVVPKGVLMLKGELLVDVAGLFKFPKRLVLLVCDPNILGAWV